MQEASEEWPARWRRPDGGLNPIAGVCGTGQRRSQISRREGACTQSSYRPNNKTSNNKKSPPPSWPQFLSSSHNGICPSALSCRLPPKSADDYIMAVLSLRLLVAENAHAPRTGQP